jgi:hypothetical protein
MGVGQVWLRLLILRNRYGQQICCQATYFTSVSVASARAQIRQLGTGQRQIGTYLRKLSHGRAARGLDGEQSRGGLSQLPRRGEAPGGEEGSRALWAHSKRARGQHRLRGRRQAALDGRSRRGSTKGLGGIETDGGGDGGMEGKIWRCPSIMGGSISNPRVQVVSTTIGPGPPQRREG